MSYITLTFKMLKTKAAIEALNILNIFDFAYIKLLALT